MALIGNQSGSEFLSEITGNVGIVGESVEIGGRHKLTTLFLSRFLKITQRTIFKSCASGAISERLSKASSLLLEGSLLLLVWRQPFSVQGFKSQAVNFFWNLIGQFI
jgi:hypothetical protein